MKKKHNQVYYTPTLSEFKRIYRVMKLTILSLLISTSFAFSINTHSQTALVNIQAKNALVKDVINEIEKQTDYLFVYNYEKVDLNRKVSVNVSNTPVTEVLTKMFENSDIIYAMEGNNILLMKRNESYELMQITREIKGTVTDSKGEPIIGANIFIKGSTTGAISDINGNFNINVSPNTTLEITYIGFLKQEIPVSANQTNLTIILQEDLLRLEEVVVVGYGTMKRSDLIGSVASVSRESLSGKAILNIDQALQGQAPGVMVTANSGQPGNAPSIRIRGIGTFNNNDPLYIVDGVPISNENGIDIINSQDVESIEVLKDAASASIYGSRAGNGVILITTKKGISGKPTVFYDGSVGFHEVSNRLDLLNAKDYIMISDEALVNGGQDPYWNGSTGRADTDWQSEIFRKGFIQSHSVGVRGSKQEIRYYISAGYDKQNGTLLETDYQRYSIKSNLDVDVTKRLTVGMNISYAYTTSADIQHGGNSVLMNAVRMPATVPAYNEDGTLGYPMGNEADGQNPIGYAQRSRATNNYYRTLVNIFAEYKIVPSLSLRSNFSGDILNSDYSRFNPTFEEGNAKNQISSLSESYTKNQGVTFENFLSYNETFNKVHHLSAMIGQSLITFNTKSTSASKSGFISNDENMRYFNAGTEQDNVSGTKQDWALLSYFGRINYNYNNKYLLQFNLRSDGSSRFGKNNKWGTFPSGAIGWRISEEQLLKNVDWVSNLKVRGSYGVLGTQPNSFYGFTTTLSQSKYILGNDQSVVIGYHPSGISNDNFKWETTYQTNIGFDMGVLDNKLSFTLEYYNKYTKDILQILPLPGIAGTSGSLTNIGEMRNWGVEFSTTYNDRIGDLYYQISGNFSTLKNEVKKLFDNDSPISGSSNRTEVGRSIGEFYGYVTDGIFQNQAEIDEHKVQPFAVPGDIRFKNLNNDDKLDADDMTFIGNPIPSITYAFSVGLEYKGFDFSVLFQGVSGNDIYYTGKSFTLNGGNNFNKASEILNRWQKEGDRTNIPRVTTSNPNDNFRTSDFFVESGAYLRLSNIQLGYTLPAVWVAKAGFRSVRVYVSGNNLVTFTKYSGYDPEITISDAFSAGNDYVTYPQPRTFLFGVNVTL